MPIVVAVSNQKGGCGKTTTVMNLAGGLHKAGCSVGVVDTDPQASATVWSLARGQDSLPFEVWPARHFRGRFAAIRELPLDVVLVDCPPGVTEGDDTAAKFARSVLKGADAILVPLRPSFVDYAAASTFVRYLSQEKPLATKTAVLINSRQHNRIGDEARDQAARLFLPIEGAIVLRTTIGLRTPITEVTGSGKTIFDYAPRNAASTEYFNLTREILQWLNNAPHSVSTTSAL